MNDSKAVTSVITKHFEGLPRERFSPMRTTGYTLYCSWVLATFYSTFLYASAPDFRYALYLHMFASLAALALCLFFIARFVKRADKWVLSRRVIYPTTAVLSVVTLSISLIDPSSSPFGVSLIVTIALMSGISSGVLFLGWARLFTDAGTKVALIEVSLSWFFGAIICLVLTYLPTIASVVITVAIGAGSGVLLRRCALLRPGRPEPLRKHKLHKHTKKLFIRGFLAAVNFGFVEGFADVISGYRFFSVSEHYGALLLLGVCLISLAAALIATFRKNNAVTYIHRLAFFTLAFGCLSIPFMAHNMTYPNIIIMGGYVCFSIVLFVAATDVSNYFDISAIKSVGYAFAALYIGETLGSGAAHLLGMIPSNLPILNLITFFLIGALIFANLFLFTEKDLTETHLGEMTDSDTEKAEMNVVGETEAENMDVVCSYMVKTYGLSAREADVLPLVIKGRTIARIQEELFISAGTVSTHVRHIYQKTGVKDRQALLDLIDTHTETRRGFA